MFQLEDIVSLHKKMSAAHLPEHLNNAVISVDGVEEYASGGHSLDVFSIMFPPCRHVYHVSIWRKDGLWTNEEDRMVDKNDALDLFVKDIIRTLPNQVKYLICDAPKRAQCRQQVGHNGTYACDYCIAEAAPVHLHNSKKDSRRWPYETSIDKPLRTNAAARDLRNPLPGMQGVSPLLQLDASKFDFIQSVPVECMHTFTNLVKRMFNLTFSGGNVKALSNQPRVNVQLIFGLTRHIVFPREFSRRARDINVGDYKMSEWRNLILFLVPQFVAPLDSRVQKLWLRLFVLMRAAYMPDEEYRQITFNLYDQQREWYRAFTSLFGAGNCTYSVHQVGAHLHNVIRKLGPVTETSAFPFEYGYSKMRRRFKGSNNPIKQIMTNCLLEITTKDSGTHKCRPSPAYSPWHTQRAHNNLVYTFQEGAYQFYEITGVHEEEPITVFTAQKFLMVHYRHPACPLQYHQVGVFQRTYTTTPQHLLLKSHIKGKVILMDKAMVAVPANVLQET